MKLLVVGAAGQVGRNLVRRGLERGDEVVGAYNARPPDVPGIREEQLDKTNEERCRHVVLSHRPDVILDTGALHNVDYCESHPEEAHRVNRDGTRYLAEAARAVGAKFVFVSTDFVFDGTGTPPYRESDPTHPQSVYAESKLAGERATLGVSADHLVVRPSVIYSWVDTRQRRESSSGKGMNFGTWVVEEVAAGRPVRIINDQVASPTLADDLAGALFALVDKGAGGTFHAAGRTSVTRYDFTVRLVRQLGLETGLVHPVATRELAQKAVRPTDSSLSSAELERVTGYRTMDLDTALLEFAGAFESDPGSPRRRSPRAPEAS